LEIDWNRTAQFVNKDKLKRFYFHDTKNKPETKMTRKPGKTAGPGV